MKPNVERPGATASGKRSGPPARSTTIGAAAGDLVGGDRDRPAEGGSGAHDIAGDEAGIGDRLALAHLGDVEGNRHRAVAQTHDRQLRHDDLALDRLFPRHRRRDFFAGGLSIITLQVELVDLAHDDLQEADPHLDRGVGVPAQQALRLHMPWVAAFGLGPGARKDAAEGPALPVFYRRRPIGIKDVALVEDCAGDFGDPKQIHRAGSADAASSNLCKAASKVGKPRCRL